MSLSLYSAPAGEPVSLDEAKAHLRVDVDDENVTIDALITAAREWIESFTARPLLPQTWDLKLDAFPCGAIVLPKPPVTAVSSITYLDGAGVSQAWGLSNYLTDLPSGPKAAAARITPAYGVSYPATYGVMNAVTIRFVCGYANAESVPAGLRAAMLLLIGHWYMNRESVNVTIGSNVATVPQSVESLAWPFRSF